ncbi:YkgJ family cysteine cluster protein [Lysobacter sp. HDW10]|jgi:Fe-S-cluster containining protein|uniref:YkgJ family cysteine cluster protein n=1 Tax=Lysobacter sp. HDW10 TaxID=2714936 RepID=UPI00140AA8AC|nr:YkgJ family cysteine cluster protein [Lysobacter sp. HDW10]QIK80686.1 YkgJ family cysteine cluster protein [Lysobacter sp. HDW10]
MPASIHPCLSCGACCAAYRVAFHWSEADDAAGGTVPVDLTLALRTHERAMRGTDAVSPRCAALAGTVGVATHCSIYDLRPSPCRAVQASWADGAADAQCDRARIRHGLPVLTPEDWC